MVTPLVLAADAPAAEGCTGFQFNLDEELKLFAGDALKIEAASAVASAPAVELNQLYRAALNDQSGVRFAAQPGKATSADGAFAGILRLAPTQAATLRITLSEGAWIDLISGERPLDSSRHTGSASCKLLQKSVEFSVVPGTSLVIQISGSRAQIVAIAVTSPL
jgi:hypothetical protein